MTSGPAECEHPLPFPISSKRREWAAARPVLRRPSKLGRIRKLQDRRRRRGGVRACPGRDPVPSLCDPSTPRPSAPSFPAVSGDRTR